MSYIKDPNKYVRQRFEERGAVAVAKDPHGTMWRFPDGRQVHVPRRVSEGAAAGYVRDVAVGREVVNRAPFSGRKVRGPKPRLDLERCKASAHAIQRLALMREQIPFTERDLLYTLRFPIQEVFYSDIHDSWIWRGEVVALPISFDDQGHATIRTVLWSKEELWAIAPRPEGN